MKTVHKFTLKEAEDILRKEYNIKEEDEIEIETVKTYPDFYAGGVMSLGVPC